MAKTRKFNDADDDMVQLIADRRDREIAITADDRALRTKCYDYVQNDQWPEMKGDDEIIKVTLNRIYKKVLHVVGLATQAKPFCKLTARQYEDIGKEEGYKELYQYTMDRGPDRETKESAIWDQHIGGLGIGKEQLDRNKSWPFGELDLTYVDPDNFHIDPECSAREQYRNAGWMIEDFNLSEEEVEAQFPESSAKILESKPIATPGKTSNEGTTAGTTDYNKAGGAVGQTGQTGKYLFCEMWYAKHTPRTIYIASNGNVLDEATFKELPKKRADELSGQETQEDYKKITGTKREIWCCTACMDAKIIVTKPKISPYEHKAMSEQQYPYTFFIYFSRKNKVLPIGMVHFMMALQDLYNRLNSITVTDAIQSLLGGFQADEEALTADGLKNLKKLGSEANVLITVREGASFKRIERDHIKDGFLTFAGIIAQQMEDVSYPAIASGEPPFRMSGKALSGVRADALTRLLLADQNINRALTHHGRMRFCNIQQFMRQEKAIRISDKFGKPRFLTVNGATIPQKEGASPGPIKRGFQKLMGGETEQQGEAPSVEVISLEDPRIGEFDLDYNLGIDTEAQKREIWELMIALADRQAADRRALLEHSGANDWQEILARMDQKDKDDLAQNQALQLGTQIMENPMLMQYVQQAMQQMQTAGAQK